MKPKPESKWTFVDQTREKTKHRTEWCAEANKYWKRQQAHEDARKVQDPNTCRKNGKWGKRHLGGFGSVRVHVDNMGIIDGLRRGESECIKPRAGDADLWKILEELHGLSERDILVEEEEHVKARRMKKRNICRILRGLSPKAMSRLMSWQKQEQCWVKAS